MPIHEPDPWRAQYFEDAVCPDAVDIPTDDPDSWRWYPAHRWVYDKIAIAQSQKLDAGPHGVTPPRFPVFSKRSSTRACAPAAVCSPAPFICTPRPGICG